MRRSHIIIASIIALIVLAGGWVAFKQAPEPEWTINDINTPSRTLPLNKDAEGKATATQKPENAQPEKPAASTTDKTIVFVDHDVPFITQAPKGDWNDERQQDGCEEASALMAMRWAQGKSSISSSEGLKEITGISDFELKKYGEFRDISLSDLKAWVFEDYFKYNNTEVKMDIGANDIIQALLNGSVVIAPMQGQRLGNPNFSGEGPERHMLLIRGYDPKTKEFITNDPGTKRGKDYRYSEETIMNAILAYPTGSHEPVSGEPKGILIVKK